MSDQELSIEDLEFDANNARRRTERSNHAIRTSLQKFGPLRSLVGQRLPDGRIIIRAGNGTLEEAGQLGFEKARIVERQPDELIVVVADDLPEEKWRQYAVADNRSSDLSEWDVGVLAEAHEEVDLSDWFNPEEIEDWDNIAPPEDEEWNDAFNSVPSGDRAPFQEMTFTLHDEQAEQVKAALSAAKGMGPFNSENKNSNGNALSRVCEVFLTQHGIS